MDEKKRVYLFTTCLVDQAYPEVAVSVVKLLRSFGVQVIYLSEQVCCGQPFFNSGFIKEAKKIARQTILLLEDADAVVIPSGSCTTMIRKEYPHLFADEPEWAVFAAELAEKTFELTEYLVDELAVKFEGSLGKGKQITYHDSCHMNRTLGISEQPRNLLVDAGYEIVEMEESDRCCGFGGVFFVQMPEVADAMTEEKLSQAKQTETNLIVTSDPGCLMKMRLAAKDEIEVKHIAEILAGGQL